MIDINHKQIHFIIGIGRSGTTLLTKILNKHLDIHCQPEANFLLFFLNHFKHQKGFTAKDIDLIFEQIQTYALSHPIVGWNFNVDQAKKAIQDICDADKNLSYKNLCKHIYSQFKPEGADKSEATIYIDKNPGYTILVDKIYNFTSDSKFIWLLRDYRANVLSRKQSSYLKSPAVAFNAIRWLYFNYIALKFQKKHPNNILIVRYEDLVSNENDITKEIYNFLNVDETKIQNTNHITFTPSQDIPAIKNHEKYLTKKYNDLNQPINTNRVNSWKTELNNNEIILCETICGNFAKQFGYQITQKISFYVKTKNTFNHLFLIIKSIYDIEKDRILYFAPIHFKMKRLTVRHKRLNFDSKK
jgi:hypothetical protein